MVCSQCQGIEDLFDEKFVTKELTRYQKEGPSRTTRMLIEALKNEGVQGSTLLDIGGGVGAIQQELIGAGAEHATDVDASPAYMNAARTEARRRGYVNRVNYLQGNFVDLAADVQPADIVTLDRVICCYPDVEKLVGLSAARARKIYGLVFPRDTWWMKIGMGLMNFFFKLRRNPYRSYVHPFKAVEEIVNAAGFERRSFQQTFIWQVVVYTR